MNSPWSVDIAPAEPGWGLKRWVIAFAGIWAFQWILFGWSTDRESRPPSLAQHSPITISIEDGVGSTRSVLAARGSDPALLVGVSELGFGAAAWRAVDSPRLPPLVWDSAPVWLDARASQFGVGMARMAEELRQPMRWLTDRTRPAPDVPAGQPAPVRARTVVEVGPSLAERGPIGSIALGSIAAPDLLRPTVIEVVVTSSGRTSSARLIQASGSADADAQALAAAREAGYRPVRGAGVQRTSLVDPAVEVGEWRVHWHIVPVPASGAAP